MFSFTLRRRVFTEFGDSYNYRLSLFSSPLFLRVCLTQSRHAKKDVKSLVRFELYFRFCSPTSPTWKSNNQNWIKLWIISFIFQAAYSPLCIDLWCVHCFVVVFFGPKLILLSTAYAYIYKYIHVYLLEWIVFKLFIFPHFDSSAPIGMVTSNNLVSFVYFIIEKRRKKYKNDWQSFRGSPKDVLTGRNECAEYLQVHEPVSNERRSSV